MNERQSRRRYLQLIGSVGVASISGCASDGNESQSTSNEQKTTEQETTNYDPEQVRENSEYIPYKELFRNIESNQGKAIYFPGGEVAQVSEEDDVDVYRIYVGETPEDGSNDVYALYYGDGRLLEEDQIELWGVVEGTETYETVMGDERTIPKITLVDYEDFESQRTIQKPFGEYYETPNDIFATVFNVDLKATYDYEDYNGDTAQAEPEEGNQWCFVFVDATNESDSTERLPYEGDIKVISGDRQYDDQILYDEPINLADRRYEGEEVQAGITRTGWIPYQIPSGLNVEDLKVVWSDEVPGLEWTVEWTED